MKNFFITLVLSLLTFCTFSQSFARAYQFSYGHRDYSNNQIVWNGQPSVCNILIRIDGNQVVIHSKVLQTYHVISKLAETQDGVLYRMSDSNGTLCNFYMGPTLDNEHIYISIEYSDYAWIYTCVDETN